MFITRVCAQLDKYHVPYAIVGGHAVALHGAVRGTVDLDFVIRWSAENLANAELALKDLGLVSRLPINANDVFKFRHQYIQEKNLIAWNFYNSRALDEQVDLIINFDLSNHEVVIKKAGGTSIRVLSLGDLIKMKRASARPQDLLDIEALETFRK